MEAKKSSGLAGTRLGLPLAGCWPYGVDLFVAELAVAVLVVLLEALVLVEVAPDLGALALIELAVVILVIRPEHVRPMVSPVTPPGAEQLMCAQEHRDTDHHANPSTQRDFHLENRTWRLDQINPAGDDGAGGSDCNGSRAVRFRLAAWLYPYHGHADGRL